MLHPLLRTLIRVLIASLVLGAVLAHFGVTADHLMHKSGLTVERLQDYARRGLAWLWPNVLLGSLVIVPVWFLFYLFRPPRRTSSND